MPEHDSKDRTVGTSARCRRTGGTEEVIQDSETGQAGQDKTSRGHSQDSTARKESRGQDGQNKAAKTGE